MLPKPRSIDDYGGALKNYSPVIDPETDEDAAKRNRYVCDTAMMMHVTPAAFVRFVAVDDSTPSDPATYVHDALWGSNLANKPVVARSAEGVWTVTWPETVQDELSPLSETLGGGEDHDVALRFAIAQAVSSDGRLQHATAEVTGPNEVTVRGYEDDGTPSDIAGATISVVVW